MATQTTLYPAIRPHRHFHMDAGQGHKIYVEQAGNADGIPVLFLHGGPGGGISAYHRQFFDPNKYHIILFDQRGCGKSTPHATLEHNTTADLLADIEQLRQLLDIDRWVLFGGSWGSTLALIYAQAYPEQVLGLILRGIFLCRQQDINWFYQFGASELYPDEWQHFLKPLPEAKRQSIVQAYYDILTGQDEVMRMAAAKAWSVWEGSTASLQHDPDLRAYFADPYVALAMARIECHYFIHNCFIAENQIIEQAQQLADIPGIIVHGRHDVICPLSQAWALHSAWPQADFRIIENAGHAASDPPITAALVQATQKMLDLIN